MPKKIFITLSIIILAAIGGSFAVLSFSNSKSAPNNKDVQSPFSTSTPSPTPSYTSTPTVTPTVVADKIAQDVKNLDKWIYYPVDKVTALPSDFVPANLVNLGSNGISVASNGLQMRKEVITDMKDLFDAAKSDGISLRVTSSYRSYSYQETLFNSYVQDEINKGKTKDEATIEANRSSALPGHSEHQLGTTCDILSGTDLTLDFTETNKKAWKWLDDHLVDFGFVLSYPDGKEDKTGYVYEPWHIRWVGKEVAKEIKNTDYLNPNSSNTSTSFIKKIWDRLQ